MESLQPIIFVVVSLLGLALGFVANIVWQRRQGDQQRRELARELDAQVLQARSQANEIINQGEMRVKTTREEAEQKAERVRRDLEREDERLRRRREDLDQRIERLEERDRKLNRRQSHLDKRQNELAELQQQREEKLQAVARMTVEEARQQVLAQAEENARNEVAGILRQVEADTQAEADRRARDIISLAIQRLASQHVSEVSVSVVPLPSDDMKGRIIGRNGRNIRAFELATGVDVIVDDTPEAVTVSSFDPIRREVAKRTMAKLVSDGRIQPTRIEQLVEDARAEVETIIREEGERAVFETGVPGLPKEVVQLLGRLRFRTSYGQNQHAHVIETAHIAGMMAAELKADVNIAKTGGLLHDIGKAIDHELEGTHAAIGAAFCERHGVHPVIVNCIASHHHEVEQESLEAVLVEAADAISGARPGARRESLEAYIKRVKSLEEIASAFPGVEHSFALQAGREVRIIVRSEDVDDLAAMQLSRDIARRIEEMMQYPGQIKVHVIRELRAVDYAV